jgi:hypothetical protein
METVTFGMMSPELSDNPGLLAMVSSCVFNAAADDLCLD